MATTRSTRSRSLSGRGDVGGDLLGGVPREGRGERVLREGVDVAYGFFDGSALRNPEGPGGFGYLLVVEKPHPMVLGAGAVYVGETVTNNVAEYCGVEGLLGCALECRVRRLFVVGDAEVVIEQNSRAGGRRDCFRRRAVVLREWRERVQRLVGRFEGGVSFHHVNRERNGVADKWARLGSRIQGLGIRWRRGMEVPDPRLELSSVGVGTWLGIAKSVVGVSGVVLDVNGGERMVGGPGGSVEGEGEAGAAVEGVGSESEGDQAESDQEVVWPEVVSMHGEWPVGWEAIDRVSAKECQESVFLLWEFVPNAFAELWMSCLARVLLWWEEGRKERRKRDRALKWFLVLPSLLLRKVRGGQRGWSSLHVRFAAWEAGEYGKLVRWWLNDRGNVKDWVPVGRGGDLAGSARVVEQLVAQGEISRAVRRATSLGVASTSNQAVVDQLREKHPSRHQPIPPRAAFEGGRESPSMSVRMLEVLRSLPKKGAPGLSGWRNEYLRVLLRPCREGLARSVVKRVDVFANAWVNGELPPWWYELMCRVRCVALVKKECAEDEVPDCRPIAVGEVWRRAIHKAVALKVRQQAEGVFCPQQVAVGVSGGMSKMVFGLRLLLEVHPEWSMVKVDLKNAFNEVDRVKVLLELARFEDLRGLLRVMHATLLPEAEVFFYGVKGGKLIKAPFTSQAGVQQGDALSCIAMCAVLHRAIKEADETLVAVGGACRGCMDDVVMVGPSSVLKEVVERYKARVSEWVGASVSVVKSGQFSPSGEPVDVEWLKESVWEREGSSKGYGLSVLGIPVGDEVYVRGHLGDKGDRIVSKFRKISSVLRDGHLQSLWTILYYSFSAQFLFWVQHLWGEGVREVSGRVDREIAAIVQEVLGVSIDALTWSRIRLPASVGGLGVRSLVEWGPAAYVGTFFQSVSSFLDDSCGLNRGFFPQLQGVFGSSFLAVGVTEGWWRVFLQGGSPTARAYEEAWGCLRGLVGGNVKEGNLLASPAADVRIGKHIQRGYQRLLTETREGVLRDRVEGMVGELPTQDSRRLAWKNVDAFSRMWVGAWPCADCYLSNSEFREVATTYLGLASPVCVGLVGQSIGTTGRRVDAAGFALTTASVSGDGWRKQHDELKWVIAEMARSAGVSTEVEVYGLFAPYISRQPRDGRVKERQLQGMVPDLLLELGGRSTLWDVKTLHCGSSTYQWGVRNPRTQTRAVDRREGKVAEQCHADAVSIDEELNRVAQGVKGPVLKKLEEFGRVKGLVFGAFGEVSGSVVALVRALGDMAARRSSRELGVDDPRGMGRSLEWVFRRRLAMVGWRGLVRLRLSRARFVGSLGDIARRRRGGGSARRGEEVRRLGAGLEDWAVQRGLDRGRRFGGRGGEAG